MSDTSDYFVSHAVDALRRAETTTDGPSRLKQRIVAEVYRLLARNAICEDIDRLRDLKPHKLALQPIRTASRGQRR